MSNEVKQRTESIKEFFTKNKAHLEYVLLGLILWFGYKVRTSNLHLLKDQITGKFIMADPDATAFLRYARYVAEHGQMMANDILRYHPIGFNPNPEFTFLSHVMAKLYHVLHFFNDKITVEYAAVIYPAVAFTIGIFFFYLTTKELLDKKTALLASALLTIVPGFLFRTMAGVSDKEALGIMFFFITTYLFIKSWKQKTTRKAILFGFLTALATIGMGLAWGGVNFLYLIVAGFVLAEIALDKFNEYNFYSYATWVITLIITYHIIYPYPKLQILEVAVTVMEAAILLALIASTIRFLIHKYDIGHLRKLTETKLPPGLFSICAAAAAGALAVSIWQGPHLIVEKAQQLYVLFNNVPTSRWILTVAESHQPYVVDWYGQFSKKLIYIFFAGTGILFYNMIKPIKEHKWHLTGGFMAFILAFTFSRHKAGTVLDGQSNLAMGLYAGSLLLFLGGIIVYYLYSFKNKPNIFKEILSIDKRYTFLLIWVIIALTGARTAIRMIFFFAPIVALVSAYTFTSALRWVQTQEKKIIKFGGMAITLFILFSTLSGFSQGVIAQGQSIGAGYNLQWQKAMDWTQHNTPEDAVFAHWWDYGYYVQTGGNRATISDGGNARSAINYYTGRYLLTATDYKDALDFLYANKVTHVLIDPTDIGKYGAYSSIGSDVNYDRRSYIATFSLDPSKTQETRDSVVYTYMGTWGSDEDFSYQGQVYPQGQAGIGGIFVKAQMVPNEDGTLGIGITEPPTAATVFQGKQTNIPIKCIFINGQEIVFNIEDGHQGCLYIMPNIANGNQVNPIGTSFYLSRRVYESRMARLYLLGDQTENFKTVYSDQNEVPIAYYQGRFIGPLKIWEVTYPNDIEDIPLYREQTLPEGVDKV